VNFYEKELFSLFPLKLVGWAGPLGAPSCLGPFKIIKKQRVCRAYKS